MFSELAELAKTTTLTLLISAVGEEEMKVAVIPKPAKEGSNPALNQPLILTGTPAELDEKMPEILTQYKTSRKSLEETLDAAKTVMEVAGKSAQEAASAAAKKSSTPAKTTPDGAPVASAIQQPSATASDNHAETAGKDEELLLF